MKSHEAFQKSYKNLNTSQREAVDTIDGPVMVIAGPGTGKTTLLTLRIANILLKTDTKPEQILALTFTDSGVKAMKEKLRHIIGSVALKVNVFTYHSFAEQIIRRYSEHFEEFNEYKFLHEEDGLSIIEDIVDKGNFSYIKSVFNPFSNVHKILKYIQSVKRELISPSDLEKLLETHKEKILSDESNYASQGKNKGELKQAVLPKLKSIERMKELALVYASYEEKKKKLGRYDFDDVINQVVYFVEKNQELKFEIAESFQYILADEHQDANRSQNSILDFFNVTDDSPNIMVVGDEKQAIFRFQGGTLENFLGFKSRYKDAKLISLTENFRSHQNILDYSFDLMSGQENLLSKENLTAKSIDVGEGKIKFVTLFDKRSEVEFVVGEVKKIIETSTESVAIIYRKNKEKEELARLLDVAGVQFVSHSDNELFQNRFALEFVYLIKVLLDFDDNESFSRLLLGSISPLDVSGIQKIHKELYRTEKTVCEVLSLTGDLVAKQFVSDLKELSSFGYRNSPLLFIEEFSRKTLYLKNNNEAILKQKLDVLRAFADIALQVEDKKEGATIRDFYEFISKVMAYEVKINIPKTDFESRVTLMTAHKSKGLEFDVVFVMNCTELDWGEEKKRDAFISIEKLLHGSADKESLLEDSRKLLYVAMTRAKKSLYLTFPRYKADGRENEVSGLVEEITRDNIERVVVTEPGHQMFLSEVLPSDKVEFYRNIFLSESFSVTALNNYLTCPNKYLFNNLLRFPFAMSLQLHVGNAVHSALEEFWMLLLRDKPYTEDTLYQYFERNLRKKPIRERDIVATLKKYKDNLLHLSGNFNLDKKTLIKPEFKLSYDYSYVFDGKEYKIAIKGAVDRVDDVGGSYVVTDFKTGEIKTRGVVEGSTKDSNGDYLRQIVFYRMIMEKMDEKIKVSRGQVYFVLRDEKKKTTVHEFELTDELVSNLKVELEHTFREIMSGIFLTKGCHEKDCEFCKLKESLGI